MQFTIKIFLYLCLAISANGVAANPNVKVFTDYLSSLQAVAIDFTQIDSHGQTASGKLIIQKPHKFRLNYYAPYPLLLLGNKNEVIMYDYGLVQTTRINAKDNMFNFLLVDSKDWQKNFKIEHIFKTDRNIIAKLYNYATERTISIVLSSHPQLYKTSPSKSSSLKQIIVDEPDGNVIEVFIEHIQHISTVDKDLFFLPNPDVFGKPSRLSKDALAQKYKNVVGR